MGTSPGKVYLVGAGPGHPRLLTVRAVECLAAAELVLYDQLVSPRLLELAPSAEKVCVWTLAPRHAARCPHVHTVLIEAARAGKTVVRLKGGDPLVFGRGGEEAAALAEAEIPFEIVPGVTAALGAAAFAGIPLTHRLHASAVALVTGHEDPAKEASLLDWEALARFPGTLVFYMGLARLETLAGKLTRHGKPADTPAAIIERATWPGQRVLTGTLAELPRLAREAGIASPALTLVGEVVSLRPAVDWFGKLPLRGQRVAVTRPAGQNASLIRRLEDLGAAVLPVPLVEIREPADWGSVDAVLARLCDFDWLVFSSVNGVRWFFQRLLATGRDLRALGHLRLAAIGPATAEALRDFHLQPDVVPEKYQSEYLVQALRERVRGQSVLLARANRGRELLREGLAEVARVEQVAVYTQLDAQLQTSPDAESVVRGEVDFILLSSPNILRALARAMTPEGAARIRSGVCRLVTISPVTSSAARDELGWPIAAEAEQATEEGLVQALLHLFIQRRAGNETDRC